MTDSSDAGEGSARAQDDQYPGGAGDRRIFGGQRAGAIAPAGVTGNESGRPAPSGPATDASGRHSHLGSVAGDHASSPVETQPVRAQPAKTQPGEAQPIDTLPVETHSRPRPDSRDPQAFLPASGPVPPAAPAGNGIVAERSAPQADTVAARPADAQVEVPPSAGYGSPRANSAQPISPQPLPAQPTSLQPISAQPLPPQPHVGDQWGQDRRADPDRHPHQGVPGGARAVQPAPAGPGPLPTRDQPRPESLLVPSHRAGGTQPAQTGWQGWARRASGGLITAQPSPREKGERQDARDIQRTFTRPMTIVVVQPKGGAGKTPTTIGLASALGANRGGYVIGWDDNETRGTLAVRVDNADHQSTTVWDLLGDLASFERTDARVGDLSHYVRTQGAAQFDALVSDDSPGNMAQIGESEFQRLHTVLQRFYRQIVIDTGNNVRSPNWQAAVNAADQIVVVSTYQRDVGYSGSWVLDHLIETGRAELAASAITVLTAADPRQDPAVRSELIDHFRRRTQGVVEIPYDPLIALGGPIEWLRLEPDTRRAWVHAGAAVVNALAARDEVQRLAHRSGG